MKKNVLLRASLVVAISGLFASAASAATSVSIKVNPKPTLTVTTPVLSTACPDSATVYYNGNPDGVVPSAKFNLPSLAGVSAAYNRTPAGTVTLEYNTARDFADATKLTPAQVAAYRLNHNSTDSIFVRAYQDAYACYTAVQKITFSTYAFPNLGIVSGTGAFEYCALDSTAFSTSAAAKTYAWSLAKGTAVGTLANASTATPGIKWKDNLSGAAITDTLILTYTTNDDCSFTVKREVVIRPRPKFTNTDTVMCHVATVDLTKRVSVDVITKAEVEYSLTKDFSTTITASAAASYTVDSAAFPNGQKFYVRPIAAANACPNVDSFTVTIYSKIGVELVVVDASTTTTNYEDCAVNDGAQTQTMTLKITVTGGCPTASNYVVDLTAASITNITGQTGVTVSGTKLTITKSAANAGAEFTVDVPVDGTAYSISVDKVAQDGASPSCNCERTF